MDLRFVVNVVSGVLGFIIPTYFAWTIFKLNLPQNVASWGLVFFLDLLGLVLAWKAGNRKPFIQVGWTVASICILVAIFFSNYEISWGKVETISVLLSLIAIYLWLTKSAGVAMYAYIVAMYTSFVPVMTDYWNVPQPQTGWLWMWTIITCIMSIWAAEKRNWANTAIQWAAIGLNGIILILCYL
jgi:hypothetical protein